VVEERGFHVGSDRWLVLHGPSLGQGSVLAVSPEVDGTRPADEPQAEAAPEARAAACRVIEFASSASAVVTTASSGRDASPSKTSR
jgi:hypothetical protein